MSEKRFDESETTNQLLYYETIAKARLFAQRTEDGLLEPIRKTLGRIVRLYSKSCEECGRWTAHEKELGQRNYCDQCFKEKYEEETGRKTGEKK